jgi:hypothetical protein
VIQVTLTDQEMARAHEVGAQRIALAEDDPRFAFKPLAGGGDTHTQGAMAEVAAARAIGVPWPARVADFGRLPDLDPFWEIRWSTDERHVRITPNDRPDALVCHVTGRGPLFEVWGFTVAGYVQDHVEKKGASWYQGAYYLTPMDPGFHSMCAWYKNPAGVWLCLYCGAAFEQETK